MVLVSLLEGLGLLLFTNLSLFSAFILSLFYSRALGGVSDSQSVSKAVDRLIPKSQEFRPNKTLLKDYYPFLI